MDIIAPDEKERIENLNKYKIIYTKSEPVFDQLAAITATMLNTPVAMINFIDRNTVWTGRTENNMNNDDSTNLCSLAVLKGSENAFQNATKELFLISNPLIAGEYGLKFYAAAPITTDDGFHVGSVCIVDKQHRSFSEVERQKLEWVASMVRLEMNKRIALHACA
ncbi:GAF domain-containing protein [Pedobacter frigoris]|uniref:GAF domain-containing protein n=1 Tax=Pedobacter frigoris TaxID=2571272 RepID=UPI00292F9F94|nr:GAF domain-containing protein [Pedobacter frigoris]